MRLQHRSIRYDSGSSAGSEPGDRPVAQFQHPNIIQIYEINEASGLPYFSLESDPDFDPLRGDERFRKVIESPKQKK